MESFVTVGAVQVGNIQRLQLCLQDVQHRAGDQHTTSARMESATATGEQCRTKAQESTGARLRNNVHQALTVPSSAERGRAAMCTARQVKALTTPDLPM
jgi:hypothetical protein